MDGVAELFGTRGLVKIRGAIDGEPFTGAFIGAGRRHAPAAGQGGVAEDDRQAGGRYRSRPDRRADRV